MDQLRIPDSELVQIRPQLDKLFELIPLISDLANRSTVHIIPKPASDSPSDSERQGSFTMQSGSGSSSGIKIDESSGKVAGWRKRVRIQIPWQRSLTDAQLVKEEYSKRSENHHQNGTSHPAKMMKRFRGVLTNFDCNT